MAVTRSTGTSRVTALGLYRRSAAVYLRHFVLFSTLAGLLRLPTIALTLWCAARPSATHYLPYIASVDFALSNLVAAALAHGVITELRGERLPFGASIRRGLETLVPALGIAVVVAVLVSLGSFAYRVPALVAQSAMFVAVPVAVVERPGVLASMKRSWKLTEGYKLTVFGVLVLVHLTFLVLGGASSIAFRHGRAWTPELMQTARLIMAAPGAILGGWLSVSAIVAYHDLRTLKEGADTETIGRVFD